MPQLLARANHDKDNITAPERWGQVAGKTGRGLCELM